VKTITQEEWQLVNDYFDDLDTSCPIDAAICKVIYEIESNKKYIRELSKNVSRNRRKNDKLRMEVVRLVKSQKL